MKTVGMISLGCCKNLTDSENILGVLKNPNIVFSSRIKECDLIIINTCGFIDSAKKEALDTIEECIRDKKEDAKILVCGCFAQRYKDVLVKTFKDKVDAIVPIKEYATLKETLISLLGIKLTRDFNTIDKLYLTNPHFAYIKIGEGCKNNCSYCAIPLIRGTLVSYKKEDVIKSVENAILAGKEEIVLIAQDTTAYGYDIYENYRIHNLIEDVLKVKGVKNVRLLYLYPDEVSDDLINLASKEERLIPYFDLPLQHINNDILKSMNRRGSKEEIITIIKKIRSKVKNAIIRTTFIVGYPGETEKEFNELMKFIEEYPFDLLGAFAYSREENTKAYDMKQIDEDVKEERLLKLKKKQEKISLALNKKRIGNTYDVRVEIYNPIKKVYRGASYMSAPDNIDGYVYFTSNNRLSRGSVVKVKINDATSHDLYGEEI